jgi:hypothetical protein
MSSINSSFIHQSQRVQASVQHIVQELAQSPTTDKEFQDLTQELHETFEILHAIKEISTHILFFQVAAKALEEQLVSLAGRVTSDWMKIKMDQIQLEAANLENSLESGKVTEKSVQDLALHLQSFRNAHLPSLEDCREIAKAELLLYRAHALQGEEAKVEMPLGIEQPIRVEEYNPEVSEELMGIAYSIYRGDKKEARMKFYQLAESYRSRFLAHMQVLGAMPFTDSIATMQAFVAMAKELVGINEKYLTQAQIDELFEGLSQVNAEEKEDEDKFFSLRSKESLGG